MVVNDGGPVVLMYIIKSLGWDLLSVNLSCFPRSNGAIMDFCFQMIIREVFKFGPLISSKVASTMHHLFIYLFR